MKTIQVSMQTTLGEIKLQLFPDKAPITVKNFMRYIEENIYADRAFFYRAARLDNQIMEPKIEVIQGGLGVPVWGKENADLVLPSIAHETTEQTGILHKKGMISMGRFEEGTAASEFFICIGDQPLLDCGSRRHPDRLGYAAFGQVIEGMEVVHQIQQQKSDRPVAEAFKLIAGQIFDEPVRINCFQVIT